MLFKYKTVQRRVTAAADTCILRIGARLKVKVSVSLIIGNVLPEASIDWALELFRLYVSLLKKCRLRYVLNV